MKRITSILLCIAIMLTMAVLPTVSVSAEEQTTPTEYELYPVPQSMEYTGKTIDLPSAVNLVVTDSIDEPTVNKIKTVLDDNNIAYTQSDNAIKNKYNIILAVNGDVVSDPIDEPAVQGTIGDVDGNNNINSTDATMVLQSYAGIITFTDNQNALADVDGDNSVTSTDATLILQFYAGIISEFPTNKVNVNRSVGSIMPEATDTTFFENIDSYILTVEEDAIKVVGKNTDATFYGVVSLKWILEQCNGTIRTLRIDDFADSATRGFIEGYYGVPWSDADRISLMEFGGDFKMTSYVFAPKDDPYHSSMWTTLYPEDRLQEIKEVVDAGVESKCRFVWTIHPFMYNIITANDYDTKLEIIKAKFEQLYSIGVRQFGILADDASSSTEIQRRLCTDMTEWCNQKGDCYELIFCPQQYNKSWTTVSNGRAPYFDTLTEGLPESVQICWTGDSVCAAATQDTFDWFKEKVGREALMWINWPCNDINSARLLMGKGELLEKGVTGFCGIISNPMQQAEPSKVALFAVADYTWNTQDWDMDKNWTACFKYIEQTAHESLAVIAKHLSDPTPNSHGENLGESEELKPLLEEFTTKFNAGESIKEIGNTLINEYQIIIDACNDFETNATLRALVEQMQPWINSLRYISIAAQNYIKTAIAFEDNNIEDIWTSYSVAAANLSASQNCQVQNLNELKNVQSGAKRIIPFVSNLATRLATRVLEVLNPDQANANLEVSSIIKSSDFISVYQGAEANMNDGDESTFVWYKTSNDTLAANGYIGIDLGSAKEIGSITIKQGTTSSTSDIITNGVLEYSIDGENYTKVCDVTSADVEYTFRSDVTARYVRIRNNANTGKWYAIKDFTVSAGTGKVDISTVAYTNIPSLASTTVSSTLDTATLGTISGDITISPDKYIGVALSRIKCVDSVDIVTTMTGLTTEYSVNGVEWTTEVSNARYVRLINKTTSDITGTITKFEVHSDEISPISVVENTLGTEDTAQVATNAFDGDRTTKAWFKSSQASGNYVIYDLGQEIVINKLNFVMYDGENDYIRNGKVSISADKQNWTTAITLGNGSTDVEMSDIYTHDVSYYVVGNDNVGGISTRYIKVELTSGPGSADKWTRFSEIEINDNAYRRTTTDPTFTEDVAVIGRKGTANLVDNDINTTYLPATQNSYVIYDVSENTSIDAITFLQSPATISNAKVSVRTGADNWVELGRLNASFNKFENLEYDNILAIKLEWTDIIPELHEMLFSYKEDSLSNADKTELLIKCEEAEALNSKYYTTETYSVLAKAITDANGVIAYRNATQADVTNALQALTTAIDGLEKKVADFTELNALINTAENLVESNYEATSWTLLTTELQTARALVARGGTVYQFEADEELQALQTVIDDMVMIGTLTKLDSSKLTGYAPSYQSGEGAENAVDGDESTMWHTSWTYDSTQLQFGEEGLNNYYQITLDRNYYIGKITYLPRATQTNGNILGYKLYYSKTADGDDWKEIKGGSGTWANDQTLKTAEFTQVNARRIKIVVINTAGEGNQANKFISAREFSLYELVTQN